MKKKVTIISRRIIFLFFSVLIFQSTLLFTAEKGDVIITEFFYKSNGSVFEYIELYNSTSADIDLQNWQITIDDYSQSITTTFPVTAKNYGVVTGLNGRFTDAAGVNYLPENDPNWFGFTHTDLPANYHWLNIQIPDDSGVFIIKDDSGTVIDSVNYNTASSFPTGIGYSGRSIEFLLDPASTSADSLNDLGKNWRAAEHINSEKMINKHGNIEQGTPGSKNFVPVIITAIIPDKPIPDGFPGGMANISLDGSSSGDSFIPINIYEWTTTGANLSSVQIDSSTAAQSIMTLPKDVYPEADTFMVTLTVIDTTGIMGKRDTVIYVYEELNENPKVHPDTVYYFENTDITLSGLVTDPELCTSNSTPCTADSLAFGSVTNFTWVPPTDITLSDSNNRVVTFISPTIDSTAAMAANAQIDTLLFSLIAADPFNAADTGIVTVIIHNYNQIPSIHLDSTALAGVDIVSGLSLETEVVNNSLLLYELDPSGIRVDSTIIGTIQDADKDSLFSTIPQGKQCSVGFENFYCVSDSLVKTKLNAEYSQLSFPLIVSDDIKIPAQLISGVLDTMAYNLSTASTIDIGKISDLLSEVSFIDIEATDDKFIISEDTTNVAFNIQFNLTGDNSKIDFNSEKLNWLFASDNEVVFSSKSVDNSISQLNFTIDSLFQHFNGNPNFKVMVTDFNSHSAYLSDTLTVSVPLYIKQQNDPPGSFVKHTPLYSYTSLWDPSTHFINEDSSRFFFRIPQDASKKSKNYTLPLRFEWEKNDSLDVDTYPTLNLDVKYSNYYRLELVNPVTGMVTILKDSILHDDYGSGDVIWTEVNLENVKFPFYTDSLGYESSSGSALIDMNGLVNYQWRVAAGNYQKDDKGQDPVGISSNWMEDSLRIDLTNPFINSVDFLFNDAYPGIYDMIYEANGFLNTDLTYLNISEKTSKFSTISNLNPRLLTDSLYHISSGIGSNVITATIELEMELRDQAQNSGSWDKSIYYASVSPNGETILESPSGLAVIHLKPGTVTAPIPMFIHENSIEKETGRNNDFLEFLSPEIIVASQYEFMTPGCIEFRLEKIEEELLHNLQLVILKWNLYDWINLESENNGESVAASITSGGTYVLAGNKGVNHELPQRFALYPNFPNPFNPSTIIPFELPESAHIKAGVYDVMGREIALLTDRVYNAGYHQLTWAGKNYFGNYTGSGIYLLQVETGEKIFRNKMVLMK